MSGFIVGAIALAGSLAAAALVWWLWWRLPTRQVERLSLQIHDPKARADVEDNFRKTIGQMLGGVAILVGAVSAYFQFSQQQQAAHELLISNQVAKGFEQLASDKIMMRLGGIYALEGVMNGSKEYHKPVLEALCAFVREGTIGMMIATEIPATDVQAVLTVIGRREAGEGIVDLTGTRVPKANLSGASLKEAVLREAWLFMANLSKADLTGADLGRANLNGANLFGANLSGAALPNAHLHGADLGGAKLLNANLREANLSGAVLFGANLTAAHLSGASLRNADLSAANLRGADLSSADLSGANLFHPDLSGATINQSQLDQACGEGAKLDPGLILKPCAPAR